MNTKIQTKNAEITVKVVKVEGGYQVQSELNAKNGQHNTAYGKTYKSHKRAEREAAEWVKFQVK